MEFTEKEKQMLIKSLDTHMGFIAEIILHRQNMIGKSIDQQEKEYLEKLQKQDKEFMKNYEELKNKIKGGIKNEN